MKLVNLKTNKCVEYVPVIERQQYAGGFIQPTEGYLPVEIWLANIAISAHYDWLISLYEFKRLCGTVAPLVYTSDVCITSTEMKITSYLCPVLDSIPKEANFKISQDTETLVELMDRIVELVAQNFFEEKTNE